jgi:hypothetical protein
MILTRPERERLVIELYNQGKTIREIAQEARMSFRDIGFILKKAAEEKESEKEASEEGGDNNDKNKNQTQLSSLYPFAQAYRLFSKGKNPVQVAIELNLTEQEVTQFYKEYWNLKGLHKLTLVYQEIGEYGTRYFLKLYRLAKNQSLGVEEVSKLLTIANNDLPSVGYTYQDLRRQINSLESRKLNLTRTLGKLDNQIKSSSRFLKSCYLSFEKEKRLIDNLSRERMRLTTLVAQFKNNDKEYQKIKHTVQEKAISVLSNGKDFIRLALLSLMESIRNDPDKYSFLINIMNLTKTKNYDSNYYVSYIYGQQQSHEFLSQDSYAETYKNMLIDEAEKLYHMLIKGLINTINGTPETSVSLSSPS